jgi:histidinol dehydrogenase
LAEKVSCQVAELAKANATARQSFGKHGAIFVAASTDQARAWANRLAAEHITIERQDLPFIQNAGSIFVGQYSAQAAGDYASGPNHVLPTAGQSRFRGGLSVLDFVKIVTVQELSQRGLQSIAPAIECMASAEGLLAHANSIRARCARA